MKRQIFTRIIGSCLAAAIVFSSLLVSFGTVRADEKMFPVNSPEDLVKLAALCRLDSASVGLTVELQKDIDLKGSDFLGIPYFSGSFHGNRHTIKNYQFNDSATVQGLFRITGKTADIRDLNVEGTMSPAGQKTVIGGLIGEHNGTLVNCQFSGKVSGSEAVGGLVGKNNGFISQCSFKGSVAGEHQIGGICGENNGSVTDSQNEGSVNHQIVTAEKKSSIKSLNLSSFDISEVSEDDFLDITDIGGIAGLSTGTVTNCENTGTIGYERIGYNVGGIVGRQSGKLTGCKNSGEIDGKKDVGGIVGQAEPYAVWDFSRSKLTALQTSLDTIQTKLTKLQSDSKGTSEDVQNSLTKLENAVNTARTDTKAVAGQIDDNLKEAQNTADKLVAQIREAISRHDHQRSKELLRQLKAIIDSHYIDLNEVFALLRELRQSELDHLNNEHIDADESLIEELEQTLSQAQVTPPDVSSVSEDITALINSTEALKALLSSDSADLRKDAQELLEAMEGLSDAFLTTAENLAQIKTERKTDISASDPTRYNRGIVEDSHNTGSVRAETNVGGIAGSVSFEIAFDAEDQLNISDYLINDARYLVFNVIRSCESSSEITAKKQAAGGIVGNADFGLVADCTASGAIHAENGEDCGGIAGHSDGTIQNANSRTILYGNTSVGGIAGSARTLTGCKAYAFIKSGKERIGSIAGSVSGTAADCYFVENDIGGINGISYQNQAQPLTYPQMLQRTDVPDIFRKITVTFIAEGKTVKEVEVPFGGKLETLPEVPMDGLRYWVWNDFDNEHIYYSQTVEGAYKNPKTTISTGEEPARFLVDGTFYEGQLLTADEIAVDVTGEPFGNGELVGAYHLSVSHYTGRVKVRMKADNHVTLYVSEDGTFVPAEVERDGSYLVFETQNGSDIVAVRQKKIFTSPWFLIGGAILLIVVFIVILLIRSRKKKKPTPPPSPDSAEPEQQPTAEPET